MAMTVDAYPLTPDELLIPDVNSSLAQQQITAVVARASLIAPCVLRDDLPEAAAAALRSILIEVAVRRYWLRKRGQTPGLSSSEAVGGRSAQSDAKGLPPLFWPGEITEMQAICAASGGAQSSASAPVGSFPPPARWPDPAC